ncbi:MAG: hypothetical protein MI923_27245, partial [Phycisphaerales bacterium]|nr:hypothetical protein [Phycisphaerales bacterium]
MGIENTGSVKINRASHPFILTDLTQACEQNNKSCKPLQFFFFWKVAHVVAMELATYKIVDQSEQNSKRSGVFMKYKIIAITAVVLLVVVTALVLLAA